MLANQPPPPPRCRVRAPGLAGTWPGGAWPGGDLAGSVLRSFSGGGGAGKEGGGRGAVRDGGQAGSGGHRGGGQDSGLGIKVARRPGPGTFAVRSRRQINHHHVQACKCFVLCVNELRRTV